MNRSGGVVALTVVGVLVAGGTAAAVNTVILHSGGSVTVNSAENFIVLGSGTDSTQSETPADVGESPDPTAEDVGTTPAPTTAAAPTRSRAATSQRTTSVSTRRTTTTRTTARTTSRPVATRPRPVASHTNEHHGGGGSSNGSSGGSGHGSSTPSPSIPSNGDPDD